LDSIIHPLIGTVVAVVILPTSSAVGASNPSYSFSCLVSGYSPFASSVGDLATTSVSWPVTGGHYTRRSLIRYALGYEL